MKLVVNLLVTLSKLGRMFVMILLKLHAEFFCEVKLFRNVSNSFYRLKFEVASLLIEEV